MARSLDTLPKAGRVNEVCREWLVHEDGALAYRLQDQEIKEHYTGNKVRNAQVREDAPKARIEQYEELKYQSLIREQEENDEMIARQVALNLEREERLREQELQDRIRMQLRIDEEAAQIEAEFDLQKRLQEEKDQELARKLQEEEQNSVDDTDTPVEDQYIRDQKLAMEAQDAELARMLQEKEREKARRARERARQRKLERQQQQNLQLQSVECQNDVERSERPQRPDKLHLKVNNNERKSSSRRHNNSHQLSQYCDPEEIQVLDEPEPDVRELPNVAAIIDPTYNGHGNRSSSSSSSTTSPTYVLPTPPQELMDDIPCYMPIQGQRRTQIQSPSLSQEEKHKRRVKDGCKTQ